MDGEGSSSGQQRQKRPKQKRASKGISYENSVMNLSNEGRATLRLVTRENQRPLNSIPENSVAVFDNTCSDYYWLRSCSIAEERVKPNNRIYRYYYDLLGQMYKTRYAVDFVCANIEKDRVMIVLDK